MVLVKTGDKVWRVAGIIAELKKLKVKNHIEALSSPDILLEKLNIAPIGDDKFVSVKAIELSDSDDMLTISSALTPFNSKDKELMPAEYELLALHLGFRPIINHDYGVFHVKADLIEDEA